MSRQFDKRVVFLVMLPWFAPACRTPMAARLLLPDPSPRPAAAPPVAAQGAARDRATDPAENECLLEHAGLVLERLEARSVPEAQREIDRLAELFPESDSAKLLETLLRRELRRVSESVLELRPQPQPQPTPTPTRNPDFANEKLLEARRLLKEGRCEAARIELEAVHALDPMNVEAADALVAQLKKMGLELYSKGEAAQAVSHWQRVLEIRPGDTETLRFLQRANAVNRRM